jgi:hypothetical protein
MLRSLALLALVLPTSALAAPPVTPLPFDAARLPLEVGAKGKGSKAKLLTGLHWRDGRGENWLLFSRRQLRTRKGTATTDPEHAAYLYARLITRRGKAVRLVREVKDRAERCEFDLTAAFLPRSFGVTDLDRDGVGEVTFAYKLGCRSDVSPITLKLLVLEEGAKYILRGSTSVRVSATERMGGRHRVDRAFKRAPRPFLKHARRVWAAIAREF